MEIVIPSKLKKYVQLNSEWETNLRIFVKKTEDITDENPFFFPEYTKHNVKHINKVLQIAEKLMVSPKKGENGGKTAAIFCMSAILHDIGMFLEPAGLETLLKKEQWRKKWQTYGQELNHYSDSELRRRIGDWEDILLPRKLPETFGAKMERWDALLCGEFLRRHHPELANYITLNGFPGADGKYIRFFEGIDIDERILKTIALIAKSHGMSLDEVKEPIMEIWSDDDMAKTLEIPIYYIMVLLRLADYLDAGKDRAPHVVLEMKRFISERSFKEYRWNQRVDVMIGLSSDSVKTEETLHIDVTETDLTSTVFLEIEEWLTSVQRELDISWRYLATKYKNKYKLSIRTIDSNLFNIKNREKLQNRFVIDRAELSAAPEVLSLLAEPLYDDNPSYGVRELLQNALDACRERKADGGEYEPKIIVAIETRTTPQTFTITDNGIGMTKDVIINHFLRAGSSYRSSMEWKMAYEGKKVPRTGKFGIGVLAAFLIGDEVTVETMPVGETSGYRFTMKKDSYEPVDIERFEGEWLADGGTSIRIPCDTDIIIESKSSPYSPSWCDWFWLPKQQQKYAIPIMYSVDGTISCGEKESRHRQSRWFELENPAPFDSFCWKPSSHGSSYCNGISINKNKISFEHNDIQLSNGSVSLIDFSNFAHIDLARKELLDIPTECKERYFLEVFKLSIASSLLLRPEINSYFVPSYIGGVGIMIWSQGYQQLYPDIFRSVEKNTPICTLTGLTREFIPYDWFQTPMSIMIINPQSLFRVSKKLHLLPSDCPCGIDSFVEYLKKNHLGSPNFWKIGELPDDPIPERTAIIKDYFGNDPWIPFDMEERIKKYPRLFQQNHELFKYLEWISKDKRDGAYYSIYDYLPYRRPPHE